MRTTACQYSLRGMGLSRTTAIILKMTDGRLPPRGCVKTPKTLRLARKYGPAHRIRRATESIKYNDYHFWTYLMFSRKLVYIAILGALSAIATTNATAQDPGLIVLDTVFVDSQRSYDALATENTNDYTSPAATVGTKIPAPMREIPQSISIITSQQVKDRNVDTLDQLARKTPGLRVLSNDDGRSSIYARGYEYDEYNVDGLPAQMQSINGTLPNLVAFDRVEVMRGPSGLFDSSGEMGGIVNLVRKRPGKDFKASANLGVGTHKQYRLGADISGALNADGALRGRLLAETSGKSPEPAGQNNHHETVYAAIDWDVAPKTTVGFGYLYQQRDIAPNNGLPAYANAALLPLPRYHW